MKYSIVLFTTFILGSCAAQKKSDNNDYFLKSSHVSALKFRNIGPALTAGRIADIAVNPSNSSEYYLAVASGGVWKTTNAGNTFTPIFDSYGSYSIGCITIDPNNHNVLWLGSGENNNQRSVAYGDGIYKSEDGGKSWKNLGLKNSEHIHKIIVHPDNSDIVYAAVNGPLWSAGGDRGVYKTEDGGKTWTNIKSVSKNTGACDLVMDPQNPDVMYAAFQQRRRHVWTYIGGGPESAIYKTKDGGKTWEKSSSGLPSVDLGRIGLAIPPSNNNIVYAIVEAAQGKGGFYKSTDRGASWNKMSGYSTSGNYYQEIICHPADENFVFSMDTWLHHTEDGGKTFKQTGEKHKHVDNHCIWIDPNDYNHWRVGCDGGLYETWDAAENWEFKQNLPITQFYKVAVDNDAPFYNVYGGTQDNNSMGGPARTINNAGILNTDWYITNGGDGFESAIDPQNPDIVYAQAQYGWLVRYDRASGERVAIQPQPGKDEAGLRWNWDAPLLISPHNNKRLYFAANKLFKSDDRGDTWEAISGDLTQQIDRNKLKVMDRVWSIDAVMKNRSTTIYGNIVALDESPKQEGLLYVGTDDGLIQIKDGDADWLRIENFPTVPKNTYVNMIVASKHDANTVFACFNNHKMGDFKPYILKSTDKGKSWTPITGNLPERGSVYAIAQDHVNKNLLFAGTEFGVYFTIDGGKNWVQLGAGLPTIAIRDIAIQERENDLVLASFGRGFYVLDNYAPLRELNKETVSKEAHLFNIKPSWMYIESNPLGLSGVGSQGESMYAAPNPEYGSVFTFLMKESVKNPSDIRREKEKKAKKDNADVFYPSDEEIMAEANEEDAYLIFWVKDKDGNGVKKIKTSASSGMKRIVWNHRYETTTPVKLNRSAPGRYSMADDGYLALPGTYTVEVHLVHDGTSKLLVPAKSFEIKTLNNSTLPAEDKIALNSFMDEVSEVRRKVRGSASQMNEIDKRLKHVKQAVKESPDVPLTMMGEIKTIEKELNALEIMIWGNSTMAGHQFETKESFGNRIETIVWTMWQTKSKPTTTSINNLKIAKEEYTTFEARLLNVENSVKALETKLNGFKAPYTPGRTDNWKKD